MPWMQQETDKAPCLRPLGIGEEGSPDLNVGVREIIESSLHRQNSRGASRCRTSVPDSEVSLQVR